MYVMLLRDLVSVNIAILERDIGFEFPSFQVVPKDQSWLMKVINFLLVCITFGKMKTFMTSFTTTIGYTVYVPHGWSLRPTASRATTLRHERVHMRQRKKYGWFLFSFLYLLALPIWRAYYRTKFEKEAYEETMKALLEYYGEAAVSAQKKSIVENFTGPSYFWMWTDQKAIEAWYDAAFSCILSRR
jgi:hypothetical protein